MTYIAPSTVITFFRHTGLSPNYENTLYFASETEKNTYFANWSATDGYQVGVTSQSYQRENRNYCRVQITMSLLYNCDYMRFTNPAFENKLFYAFITAINYINNETTEVEYVIDPLMTWMGTFTLKQCFIDRQHVTNDAIGANIAEEGLSVGTYIDENVHTSANYGNGSCYIRVVIANPDEAQANLWGGIYNPCEYHDFSDASGAADFIDGLVSQDLADNIVNVYMVPTKFANPGQISDTEFVQWAKPYSTVAGYTPKNKKLFVYPYKYLMVDNSEGSQQEYKYEYFFTVPDSTSSGNYEFGIFGISGNNVQIKCQPLAYNGDTESNWYTDEYSIGMEHFPQCAWSIDTYAAYLAQKNAYYAQDVAKQTANNIITTGKTTMQSALTLNPAKMIEETGSSLVQNVADMSSLVADHLIDNTIRPEAGTQMRGGTVTDLTFGQAQKKFFFHEKSITKNYAMMIDDYFTMFGYRIGQVGTPNMNARPYYTYIKTVGCNVDGSLPANDRAQIEQLFDKGLRFWKSLDNMGNYSLDNSPA